LIFGALDFRCKDLVGKSVESLVELEEAAFNGGEVTQAGDELPASHLFRVYYHTGREWSPFRYRFLMPLTFGVGFLVGLIGVILSQFWK
jgi:hypothetical protein